MFLYRYGVFPQPPYKHSPPPQLLSRFSLCFSQFWYYMLKVSSFGIYPAWCSWTWASLICGIVFVINFLKKIQPLSPQIFLLLLSLLLLIILIIQMMHLLKLPHNSCIFCSFFAFVFSLLFSLWSFYSLIFNLAVLSSPESMLLMSALKAFFVFIVVFFISTFLLGSL